MLKTGLVFFLLISISLFSQDYPTPERINMYTMCNNIYLMWSMPDTAEQMGFNVYHKSVEDSLWKYLMNIDDSTTQIEIPKSEQLILEQTYGYSIYYEMCLGISAYFLDGESEITETCTMGIADVWPEPPYLWSIESVQDTIILKWQSGSAGCGDTASHYEVYRNFQDSSWLLISTIPITQEIYYDVPSESGKYCYYVTLVTYYRELKSWENLCINITAIRDEYDLNKNKHTIFQIRNYPNPFNPSTTIEFIIPKSEFVELKVYNILGKEVSTLVSKKLNQGNHTYTFDGSNLASGIYYYQLVAGDYREVRKMILLR